MNAIYSEFTFGDMLIRYEKSEAGAMGLILLPAALKESVSEKKEYQVDSLVQVSFEGDRLSGGFANGHTMHRSTTTEGFLFDSQILLEQGDLKKIVTRLKNDRGQTAEHILCYETGDKAVSVVTRIGNESGSDVLLNMISSFSLGGLTPFADDDAPDTLLIHRIRSKWSEEGRLITETAEDLQLEPSWSYRSAASERFGQVGSMPVRKYFPFAAAEDKNLHVIWAAQLACPSSWQMEFVRYDNALVLCGGLADYEFGHWQKVLKPGEWFEAPAAYLTVSNSDLDTACARLTNLQHKPLEKNGVKRTVPVMFNEYCTTWGNPTHENIKSIVETLNGRNFDYFVIDCGWYTTHEGDWFNRIGDWDVCGEIFPEGLEETVRIIKEAGMKPGIWFEFETVGNQSEAFHKHTDHLLKRSGVPITVGERRFWDMNDPWVVDYLTKRVIDMLNHYGFEYIKIDYNENIGLGADGAESLGEALRQNMLGTERFMEKLRREVPGLAIEICSSGGHRLEPSMLSLGDMASFSDAHEQKEIAVIAAGLHRVMLPRQSQIWSVLHGDDPDERLRTLLASTFLGVMCLSGDIYNLSPQQWEIVDDAIRFYRNAAPVITDGESHLFNDGITSWRHLHGWQAVLRYSDDREQALLVVHSFEHDGSELIRIPTDGRFEVFDSFGADSHGIACRNGEIMLKMPKSFDAAAFLLNKKM